MGMNVCPECLDLPNLQPCDACGGSAWYEACEFGCDLGTAVAAGNVKFECPACAGSGLGKPHAHPGVELCLPS
jgi:hypothetical protein